jgi:hypothetical protein
MSKGLEIMPDAIEYIREKNGDRPMTPADYASTSGIILVLNNEVWVNAPVALYNSNFVSAPPFHLGIESGGLYVYGEGLESSACLWLPPRYHGASNDADEPYNSYAFTHSDRVRISPIEGCGITCQFCDLPYSFQYRRKRVAGLVDSIKVAMTDSVQPAAHVLISGGTPRREDFDYLQEVYATVLREFPQTNVDIMMTPVDGLLDIESLNLCGVNELSINIEIFNREIASRIMPKKNRQGIESYLRFIEKSTEALGFARTRSMLLVGLEAMHDTLSGVEAIASRGAMPVLSPFRPDPATPLRHHAPPTADFMEETFLRARDVADRYGVKLGPTCVPCSHNTMTLADDSGFFHYNGHPRLI